jgi:O-antigen ligase
MSASAAASAVRQAQPAWRDPSTWTKAADFVAILIALSLPWSTSLVSIFVVVWVIALTPTLDLDACVASLKRAICVLPLALFALAAVGMFWSDATWSARTYALSPVSKLLVLPLLFYHFERSTRGVWVLVAFLVSCILLMGMSWIVAFYPSFALKPNAYYGVPVKDYIDQSQEFALCAVALAYPVMTLLRMGKKWSAAALASIASLIVINMIFVTVSRTALVTMPIMVAVFAMFHLKWRTNLAIFLVTIVLALLAWLSSPRLQSITETFFSDYSNYKLQDKPTSIGLRLEFWKKSLRFFADAPIVGHGTGSTRGLFERAASPVGDKALASSEVIGNPHNQTLNVAVQWGMVGVILLYGMWLYHLLLFRGEGLVAWIGLLVVVQNIFTSLFNSHLSDFHEGWMYVLGVGVAGGMVLGAQQRASVPEGAARP